MGCGSAKDQIHITDDASSETKQYLISRTDVRRAQGDVQIVTVQKQAELVFPLGGAILFDYKDKRLIAHIIEYTRETLRFCFLMQNGRKLQYGETLNYETVKTTPRLRFPQDNVVFISSSLSVAIILQLIQIYKVNLRTNMFAVISQVAGDIPYLQVLQKQLSSCQNQVNLLTNNILVELRSVIKESAAAIAVGPVWLVRLVYKYSGEFQKQSYCLPFFAGVENVEVSYWLQDDQPCEIAEYEELEREYAKALSKMSSDAVRNVKFEAQGSETQSKLPEIKQIQQGEDKDREDAPKKKAAVRTKKLPPVLAFPEAFDREVLDVIRIDNVLTNSKGNYVDSDAKQAGNLLIDELTCENPVQLPTLTACRFKLDSAKFVQEILYPFVETSAKVERYENPAASWASEYLRSAQADHYNYVVAEEKPTLAPISFVIDQANYKAGPIAYPFTFAIEQPNEVTLLCDSIWNSSYQRIAVHEADALAEVVEQVKLDSRGIPALHFHISTRVFKNANPYPFTNRCEEEALRYADDSFASAYVRIGPSISVAEKPALLPVISPVLFSIAQSNFTQFEQVSETYPYEADKLLLLTAQRESPIANEACNDSDVFSNPISSSIDYYGMSGFEYPTKYDKVCVIVAEPTALEQPQAEAPAVPDSELAAPPEQTPKAEEETPEQCLWAFINDPGVSEAERQQRAHAYYVFQEADFSQSGTLELQEARDAFRNQNFLDTDIEYVFSLVDSDQSSSLSFFEFYRFLSVFYAYKAQEDIRRIMFIAADKDFSNEISREELVQILFKMNAQAKFGEENVRSAVSEIVHGSVRAEDFNRVFEMVRDAMKQKLQK